MGHYFRGQVLRYAESESLAKIQKVLSLKLYDFFVLVKAPTTSLHRIRVY
jgi:hypothetical protein